MHNLTCRSCHHYRLTGCHLGLSEWPTAKLNTCRASQYEPGSDEAEDYDDRENLPAPEERGSATGTNHNTTRNSPADEEQNDDE